MIFDYLAKNADAAQLMRLVTPRFFKVISPQVLLQLGVRLAQNKRDGNQWTCLLKKVRPSLDLLGIELVEPTGADRGRSNPQADPTPEAALRLYFHQILSLETWILDLRSTAFSPLSGGKVGWTPRPYYSLIDPEFLVGVRALYRGFYNGDDALFKDSLARLGLQGAEGQLRDHFGLGDQSAVQFQLHTFQNSFIEIFEFCAKNKIKLQVDFYILGLMLIGLYEKLESAHRPMDVRGAFNEINSRLSGTR